VEALSPLVWAAVVELVMEAALLWWVVAELPANLGELVAWDYSADGQPGWALVEMVLVVAGREQGLQVVLPVSNCQSMALSNSYASKPGSLGRFGERVVIPSFFAEFVALAAFVHLLVAALVASPGAFSF